MEKNTNLLNLYRKIKTGEAVATDFEEAIKEQCLTMEIIALIKEYYKND